MRFEKFLLKNFSAKHEGLDILTLFKEINIIITSGDKGRKVMNFINSLLNQPLAEAFSQAKFYALRLTTKGFGLVSYEGIWIALEQDKYQFDKVIKYKWVDLENQDTFKTVADILKTK